MSGTLQTEMESLLSAAFAPTRLEVINDSAKHRGHTGDDGSGDATKQARKISDYIAGMTDRYAIREHRRIFSIDEL